MDVLYIGPYRQNDEWGYTSKAFANLLVNQPDVNTVLRPVWFSSTIQEAQEVEALVPYEYNTLGNKDILIQHGLPTYLNYNGDFEKNIAITSLDCRIDNTDWVSHLNLFDQIIVFSKYEAELLRQSGVTSPIGPFQWIPLYINPAHQNLALDFTGTLFYTTGSLEIRSGLRETISAYLSSFTILDNVILIVAIDDADALEQEVLHLKEMLGLFKSDTHHAHIATINSTHPAILNYLHEYADFFIDVSYNMRTNQSLLTSIANNSIPIMLDTCRSIVPDYPFLVKSNAEISLYQNRPLPLLYSGHHTWQIPSMKDLKRVLQQVHESNQNNSLGQAQATLFDFKNVMLSKPQEWMKEILRPCIL